MSVAQVARDRRAVAQALADVATIGILQQRSRHEAEVLAEQLQFALTNRVVIEQTKGVLADRGSLGIDRAFDLLRDYGRRNRLPISEVAHEISIGLRDPADIIASSDPRGRGYTS